MARIRKPMKKGNDTTTKTHLTKTELKSKEILHEIVAEYDTLLEICKSNPTATNKKNLEAYAYHLENPSRLAARFLDYTVQNEISGVSTGERYLRGIINKALKLGELVEVNGLIRNSNTVPLDNISATGNTITILVPTSHIGDLKKHLDIALANQSVQIYTLCRNLIIVVETGEQINVINDELYRIVCEAITDYTCSIPSLTPQKPSNSIKIVIS